MLKQLTVRFLLTGEAPATPSVPPVPSSAPRSPHQTAAAQATDKLFNFCEPMDVGEGEDFLAAVIGILAEYPIEVMNAVADPVRGLPSRVRRPTLVDVRQACKEVYEPIARQLARDRIAERRKWLLPAPPARRPTGDEINAVLRKHGLPQLRGRAASPGSAKCFLQSPASMSGATNGGSSTC
jgi:hypothetical protein